MLERCKHILKDEEEEDKKYEVKKRTHNGNLQKENSRKKNVRPKFTRRGSVLYRVNTNSVRPLYLYITQWSACINTCL